MEKQSAYNNLWVIELRKFTGNLKRKWTLIGTLFIFGALPWLTLRNFEERFTSYSWFSLDDSILNFVIHSTANKLSWIMIIALPWIYQFLFLEESNRFFRKRNRLFIQIIAWKWVVYAAIGGLLMGLIWFSTLCVYLFWCWHSGTIMEVGTWSSMGSPLWHLVIRTLIAFPLMLVLFLTLSKKWSYIILVTILIFAALFVFRLPYHFYFSEQRPELNLEWTFHSLFAGFILTIGLIIYYRYLSKKTHVLP